jgi:hypothetical protein
MIKVEDYLATAERCRAEAKTVTVLERRIELEAKAEHLEDIAKELAESE